MKQALTENMIAPILVTHYSPDSSYGELSPPSAGIVEETIWSMEDKVLSLKEEITGEPVLVYNYPENRSQDSRQYADNLKMLCDELGIRLISKKNTGLRDALLLALDEVSSPYIFFIEHDWKFLSDIDIESVLEVFEKITRVNYIRFNKRKNSPNQGWDTIVEEDKSMPIPLCKVSSFSNNPHVARKDVYKRWVQQSKPNLRHIYRGLTRDLNGYGIGILYIILKNKIILRKPQMTKYDDIEYVIDTKYKKLIKNQGFEQAHSEMGIYLYGGKNEGPFIEHLGW
jgi:hypothetical protein